MPADIKLSRVPHKVMIDAVMRRMVHAHYKEISRAYELCRRSQEFTCDTCTVGSPKEFLALQERCIYCSKSIGVHIWQRDLCMGIYAIELR